ncbi:MAG TPA: 23S rRNA (uracil(1939)-C(5))-methyltransferase RlmD [Terriglobales bacterium]|nr:23S rRNA (uracil(1939)-C(5))-methyltransferase RlmD [Terriglobales bacterium]
MQLNIEKLVYGGDGLARLIDPGETCAGDAQDKPPRGKAVFVPFVLPGEQVEARPIEEKTGFIRAALEKVLSPSPQRIAPLCPYFQRCGGCHYQYADYTNQLAIKRQILRETLERTAKIKWEGEIHLHPSPPWGYRNRTRMKVAASPFALGYYRHSSHDLLAVESCPISSPLINRAIAAMWALGRSGDFANASLSEIEFFADHTDARLMLELYASEAGPKEAARKQDWEKLAAKLRAHLPTGAIAVFSKPNPAKKSSAGKNAATTDGVSHDLQLDYCWQPEPFIYETRVTRYQVSPGSFFQTNRFLIERIVEIVCAQARGKLALDLYAGVGLFSSVLAKTFERVEAVEVAPASCNDLQKNVPQNVRLHSVTTAAYLKSAAAPRKADLVVVDPPRAGLGTEVARNLAALAPARLTYVSCDPATLARDLTVFLQSGYALDQVHLVDLFPQTYHIETVVQLTRKSAA